LLALPIELQQGKHKYDCKQNPSHRAGFSKAVLLET
jgi:hypothetical protein